MSGPAAWWSASKRRARATRIPSVSPVASTTGLYPSQIPHKWIPHKSMALWRNDCYPDGRSGSRSDARFRPPASAFAGNPLLRRGRYVDDDCLQPPLPMAEDPLPPQDVAQQSPDRQGIPHGFVYPNDTQVAFSPGLHPARPGGDTDDRPALSARRCRCCRSGSAPGIRRPPGTPPKGG